MTPEGFTRLKGELQALRSVERPRIIAEVGTAREHGDITENAEFHAARERLAFIEARIAQLEGAIAQAEVIDPSKLTGSKVAFGASVRLANIDSGDEVSYRIVGPEEADLEKGSISVGSPLARQLIGREVGDEVKVRTPGGLRTFEVLEVAFR